MLPGRLIYRLKLSHKSLCHWLLCLKFKIRLKLSHRSLFHRLHTAGHSGDGVELGPWIMLVMYIVIASAWCIMEAAMHAEYFSRQRFSKDLFWPWNLSLFESYRVLNFNVKTIEYILSAYFSDQIPLELVVSQLTKSYPYLDYLVSQFVLFLFLFLFSPGGTSVTHGWWTQPTSFIRSRVSS